MTKILACGLLVVSPQGWLLAHATRSPRWDIPKGRWEEGETCLEAALRETWEETGLDFKDQQDRIVDLGRHHYLRSKDMHLFRLDIPQALDLSNCCCHTYVERSGGDKFLETDRWEWVPPSKVAQRVGAGLVAYMQNLNLLGPSTLSSKP